VGAECVDTATSSSGNGTCNLQRRLHSGFLYGSHSCATRVDWTRCCAAGFRGRPFREVARGL